MKYPLQTTNFFYCCHLFSRVRKIDTVSTYQNHQCAIGNSDLSLFLTPLSTYKCFRLPAAQNIRKIILELAHQVLLQRLCYIAECWVPVVATLKTHQCFYSVKTMRELYSDLKPSSKKVIQALKATPSGDSKTQSYDFLKTFVRSLDAPSLKICDW